MSNNVKNKEYTHEFSATASVGDFKLRDTGPPPPGYPITPVPDEYTSTAATTDFETRRRHFIEFVLQNPGTDSIKGFFYELIRLNEGGAVVHAEMLLAALDYIDARHDCADFALAGILRLYYQLLDSEGLPADFAERARRTILDFKYWPDEPGIDSMCYWTENHHIIFSSCELLAGQLFPDEVFTNSGMTGRDKVARASKRINKWLELRFYTGFSEWLSNVYYDENFPALLNLVDFAEEAHLKHRARTIVDLMLYDMAINSYYGQFSCTHGRTYTKEKIQPRLESTADTAKLLFGLGHYANEDNMSAVLFALSENYRIPEVIYAIARKSGEGDWESRQRVSIRFRDADKWGYGALDLDSAMGLLSFGGYCHPRTFNHMVLMLDEFNWWDNQFFGEFAPFKKAIQWGSKVGLTTLIAWVLRRDMSRNALTEANLYTFRTADYMLSTAQDYRPGYGGDQHHIWQATLDEEAVCFTNHPGGFGEKAPDAYWHGNGYMPRALQHRNVAVILYNTPRTPNIVLGQTLAFTHAFFPRNRFDEVVERNGWAFGRKNRGYIALYCSQPWHWQKQGEYAGAEIVAAGRRAAWIVEMGNAELYDSFERFVERISSAAVSVRGLQVTYDSPSQGEVRAGWRGDLKIKGQSAPVTNYRRYDNPTCAAEFGAPGIEIREGGRSLTLKL